jgi:hypothetical protein
MRPRLESIPYGTHKFTAEQLDKFGKSMREWALELVLKGGTWGISQERINIYYQSAIRFGQVIDGMYGLDN